MKRLPPLIALAYLEAAARTRSFAAAAKELHVTPAAISQQIKALEANLGVQLFVRHHRRVSLTPAARAALPGLAEGFATLGEAVDQIRLFGESEWVVTVCAEPLFATKWIVPRLHHFYERCPEAEVRLQASLNTIDCVRNGLPGEAEFKRAGIDLSVRLGYGKYTDLDAELLLALEVAPLCAPGVCRKLATPESLLEIPLLCDRSLSRLDDAPGWLEWFRHMGVTPGEPLREQRFGNGLLALEAAIAGQGSVLGSVKLLKGEIDSGHLAVPFDSAIACPQAYYVTSYQQGLERPVARMFRDWLLESAGQP
ncbi:MAG: LysR family transcriptional regulator [Sedimenticola sp.]|nr:LysR family transcriptional regulator [Sedimenticola sp.]